MIGPAALVVALAVDVLVLVKDIGAEEVSVNQSSPSII
jgi:hypothetical protein